MLLDTDFVRDEHGVDVCMAEAAGAVNGNPAKYQCIYIQRIYIYI
jgi:hypothetical protein